jgi:hypothetical protein
VTYSSRAGPGLRSFDAGPDSPYVDGAEDSMREHVGPGLTTDELWRVIGRYVGR